MASECYRCKKPVPEGVVLCSACALVTEVSSTPHSMGRRSTVRAVRGNVADKVSSSPPIRLSHLLEPETMISGVYRIARVVGEGGMGAVYAAFDTVREREVAIKVLHPNLAGDPDVRRRFAREAQLMQSFNHPHVVSVYDFIQDDRFSAIVMEYVDGVTLGEAIARWNGRMPYDQVLLIFSGMLTAMGAAHGAGVIHRDLKPDNVLLRPEGAAPYAKIADFGIAKILEATNYTLSGAVLGTCRYMAPEQVEHPQLSSYPADIYSLGVTLFHMVTGRCPFEHTTQFALMMAHVREEPPRASVFRADVPEKLDQLLASTLEKRPEARPKSCAQFLERLQDALGEFARIPDEMPAAPEVIQESDGTDLLLIPAGRFLMGAERRSVYVGAFYIDRTPVTNQQYATFVNTTGYRPSVTTRRREVQRGLEFHPVVDVSWYDAQAYAKWAGKRLPTEAEWEKSARGEDGRKYPWGKVDPDPTRARYGKRSSGPAPVGSYPAGASPYGVLDLAGNVWEWCEDVDSPEFYEHGPIHDPCNRQPTTPEAAVRRVVRGGSWMFDARSMRTFARSSFDPHTGSNGIGFRCVRDL